MASRSCGSCADHARREQAQALEHREVEAARRVGRGGADALGAVLVEDADDREGGVLRRQVGGPALQLDVRADRVRPRCARSRSRAHDLLEHAVGLLRRRAAGTRGGSPRAAPTCARRRVPAARSRAARAPARTPRSCTRTSRSPAARARPCRTRERRLLRVHAEPERAAAGPQDAQRVGTRACGADGVDAHVGAHASRSARARWRAARRATRPCRRAAACSRGARPSVR